MFDPYVVRFRKRAEVKAVTSTKISDIIARSTSRVEVYLENNVNAIPVIFINDSKESGTESIMYSYTKNGVEVGNYITFRGDKYLVYKEIKNLKQEDYIEVFRLVLCNITFNFNGSDIKAYFRGSLRSVQSEESNLAQHFGVQSTGEAFIIFPSSYSMKNNDSFSINEKGWRVTYLDNTTNAGINYAALEEYNLVNTEKTSENEVETLIMPMAMTFAAPEEKQILAGITQSFKTEGGYIKTDKTVKITERTANLVKFIIPFGIDNIIIETKQNGIIVSESYNVRG